MFERKPFTRTDALLISVLSGLALIAALLMAVVAMERIPHLEDEATYIYQARAFARGALWGPVPPDKTAFFVPFVLEFDGKMLGKYPVGWPVVLALGERVGAGWLVNPILGALTTVLIYLLGRGLFDRHIGVLAAILAFTSPFFLIQSGTYMSHAASLFWATLFLYAFFQIDVGRSLDERTLGWSLAGGGAAGMMALTRQLPTGVLAVVVGGVLLLRLVRRDLTLLGLLRIYGPMAAISVLIAAVQPAYLWITTGDPTTNLYTEIWPYDRLGFGPGIGPNEGHTLSQGLITTRQDLRLWSSELFGWYRASWVPLLPGLYAAFKRLAKRDWLLLLGGLFVLLVGIHVAYWVGAKVYGPRYYYEAHTGLVILAALGLHQLTEWIFGLLKRPFRVWPVYALLAVLLTVNATTYLPTRIAEWHTLYGITRQPLDELDAIRETDNVLVMVRGRFWVDYAALFSVNSPWLDGPIVAAHDWDELRSRVLLEDFPDREVWYYNDGQFTREPAPYEE